MKERLQILDIWVDPLTKLEALQCVDDFLRYGKRPHVIFAANPEKNFSVPTDPELHRIFAQADLLLPDGIGIVLAARLLYGVKLERIPGADFMEELCRLAALRDYKIFIYGASEEVNEKSVLILKKIYQGIKIVGRANGYLPPDDMPRLLEEINESKADILFLALGSPKQEKWFGTYKESLIQVKVVQGIGGTLDTITGKVQRAPEKWRRAHAEWLFRLLKEPTRLSRQKVLPLFLLEVLREKLKSL